MQNIINGIDKGVQAGIFNLDEVLKMANSIDALSTIVKEHNERQALAQQAQASEQKTTKVSK